jgi:hypothetical protein
VLSEGILCFNHAAAVNLYFQMPSHPANSSNR